MQGQLATGPRQRPYRLRSAAGTVQVHRTVNVDADDYDLGRLQDRVRFLDNGRNLDSRALPIPTVTADIPGS